MSLTKKQVGKIAMCKTIAEIRSVAEKYNLIREGQIDLRNITIALCLNGEDLSSILFEGANLSGSRLTDCIARNVSFCGCKMEDVKITNKFSPTGTLEGANFSNAELVNCYFAPRTLSFRNSIFSGASLRDTTFMMADLVKADFSNAKLTNVEMRSAVLDGACFSRATLDSVCLEKASLFDVDFEQVNFINMHYWGEPDFSGAKIADNIRYRFADVQQPVEAIEKAVASLSLSPAEHSCAIEFVKAVATFAFGAPEAFFIYDEWDEILELNLFVKIIKAAKNA